MPGNPTTTVWPVLHYDDTDAALRFLTETLGFEAALVARDDGGPEGNLWTFGTYRGG